MKWRLLVAGAVAGGMVWAARRKARKDAEDGARWADATDPVARTARV